MANLNKLAVMQELISCYCDNLYFWKYDEKGQLLESSCPQEISMGELFMGLGFPESLVEFGQAHRKPFLVTNELGLMWIVATERTELMLSAIHLIGPFSIDTISNELVMKYLNKRHFSIAMRDCAQRLIDNIPIVSTFRYFEYAIMLHYCLTGETIKVGDLHYRKPGANSRLNEITGEKPSAHGTYAAEREMLRCVREGDLSYIKKKDKMFSTGSLGKLSNDDPTRQVKNMILVATVLFSRAAIEGGLNPEISMTLCDHYFQSVEAGQSISELAELSRTMQEDYIHRVHKLRYGTQSALVQTCNEYIALHLEDKISLETLAKTVGYSDYYLSKKYKSETGCTIAQTIRTLRLEHAKQLLKDSRLSVVDIAERLQFCSQSYFSDVFKKTYGMSPAAYREQAR